MTEHGSAPRGKDKYTKPRLYELGSVRDLTSANKVSGSADIWQQYQHDDSAPAPGITPASH